MDRLANKIAVITGGANGIGYEASLRFCEEGAVVIVGDYDKESGDRTAEYLKDKGYTAEFIQVDVADQSSVNRMMTSVAETYGQIDILVNNAGITRDATLKKMTEEQFRKVIDVNLMGVFHCTSAACEYMVKRGKGAIINTSSVSGVYGNFGQTNYAASKAGVVGMTKTWAKELGPKGIRTNAVAPGFTETDMVESVPDDVLNKLKQQVPLKRLGNPRDIANAYLFLASEEAAYINGHVLHVDGGIVM